jgi:hypothetical protein
MVYILKNRKSKYLTAFLKDFHFFPAIKPGLKLKERPKSSLPKYVKSCLCYMIFRLPTRMATLSFSFLSSLVLLIWLKVAKRPKSVQNNRKVAEMVRKHPNRLGHGFFSAANLVLFLSFKFSLAQFEAKMAKTLSKMAKIFKIFT